MPNEDGAPQRNFINRAKDKFQICQCPRTCCDHAQAHILIWKERTIDDIHTSPRSHRYSRRRVWPLAPQPMHGIYHVLSRLCPESISEDLIVPCTTFVLHENFQNAALGYKYFLFCLEIACNTSTWVTYFRETRRSRPGRECGISQVKKAPREPTLRVE